MIMKTMYKTIINGKELNANKLLYDGDYSIDGYFLECYQDYDFAFFFSTDIQIEEHENEQGKWKTRETFLDKLEFYLDIEKGDNYDILEYRLQPSKEQSEMILKVCQEKFYKIEEI